MSEELLLNKIFPPVKFQISAGGNNKTYKVALKFYCLFIFLKSDFKNVPDFLPFFIL